MDINPQEVFNKVIDTPKENRTWVLSVIINIIFGVWLGIMYYSYDKSNDERIEAERNLNIQIQSNLKDNKYYNKSEAGATPTEILRLENTGSGYTSTLTLTDGVTNDGIISYVGSTQSLRLRVGASGLTLSSVGVAKIDNLAGTGTRTVVADASGNLSTQGVRYKVYTALLTQTDTSAPTITTVFENTLGGTPTSAYIGVGNYGIDLTGAFVSNKTVVIVSNGTPLVMSAVRSSADRIIINCGAGNGRITDATIEIRVYN